MPLRRALVCLLLALGACRASGEPSNQVVDPHRTPQQVALTEAEMRSASLPSREGAFFMPKARYDIAARVLSRERYYLGWQSGLSPIDLALGWGDMSEPSVDKWISWHQGMRWYFWYFDGGSPYANDAIAPQSANVHIVPGSSNLRRALLSLDANDIIELQGWLVDIDGPAGERWTSSMTRDDSGNNACELLYVTKLFANGRSYQ